MLTYTHAMRIAHMRTHKHTYKRKRANKQACMFTKKNVHPYSNTFKQEKYSMSVWHTNRLKYCCLFRRKKFVLPNSVNSCTAHSHSLLRKSPGVETLHSHVDNAEYLQWTLKENCVSFVFFL